MPDMQMDTTAGSKYRRAGKAASGLTKVIALGMLAVGGFYVCKRFIAGSADANGRTIVAEMFDAHPQRDPVRAITPLQPLSRVTPSAESNTQLHHDNLDAVPENARDLLRSNGETIEDWNAHQEELQKQQQLLSTLPAYSLTLAIASAKEGDAAVCFDMYVAGKAGVVSPDVRLEAIKMVAAFIDEFQREDVATYSRHGLDQPIANMGFKARLVKVKAMEEYWIELNGKLHTITAYHENQLMGLLGDPGKGHNYLQFSSPVSAGK